jgi:hypothetical protein
MLATRPGPPCEDCGTTGGYADARQPGNPLRAFGRCPACYLHWRRAGQVPDGYVARTTPRPRPWRQCKSCGAPFQPRFQKSEQRYCSRACGYAGHTADALARLAGQTRPCRTCGQTLAADDSPSANHWYNHHFCGEPCAAVWHAQAHGDTPYIPRGPVSPRALGFGPEELAARARAAGDRLADAALDATLSGYRWSVDHAAQFSLASLAALFPHAGGLAVALFTDLSELEVPA